MIDPEIRKKLDDAMQSAKPRNVLTGILNIADCYNQAAELSLKHIEHTNNADFAAPALMCRSFAIELLLKLLFFSENTPPGIETAEDLENLNLKSRGHDYSSLFDKLKKDTKKIAAKNYAKVSNEKTSDHRFKELLKKTGGQPFVEWRYSHEITTPKHMDLKLLTQICDALGLTAVEILKARSNPQQGGVKY